MRRGLRCAPRRERSEVGDSIAEVRGQIAEVGAGFDGGVAAKRGLSMSKEMELEGARIADQLRRAFDGEAWHGDSLFEILKGVTASQAAAHPIAGAHSIWELALHIATWDDAVRRRMGGSAHEPSEAENFPTVRDAGEAAWQRAQAEVRRAHEELVAAVAAMADARLDELVPGKEGAHYTFYYMLHGVVQHEIYHAGQIALLKKM